MRIVSWNVQWGRGADGRVDWARLLAALRAFDADVICLQEVASRFDELPGSRGEDGPAILRGALPEYHGFYAPALDVPRAHAGRALFGNWLDSRLPVEQVQRVSLPYPPPETDKCMPRVLLEAVVRVGERRLRVATSHLEYYSRRQRLAQVQALVEHQREILAWPQGGGDEEEATFRAWPRPAEAVWLGDGNFAPEDEEYRLLEESGLWFDAWRLVHGEAPHAHTVGLHGAEWPDHPYCCDYAWVSAALRPAVRDFFVVRDTAASDHQPIVLDLEF